MVKNTETGALRPFDFAHLLQQVPELKRLGPEIDSYTFEPIIDSSDMHPGVWAHVAEIIRDGYERYDGFVVLHGTDTMSYTASALSFMLRNLGKPVILTGSQLPIGMIRTDGKENLITAVEIASAGESGRPVVPEVAVCFQNKLFRGNRTTKHNAEYFNAFASENYPPLAEVGINIHFNKRHILPLPSSPFEVRTAMDTNVAVLRLFPGIPLATVEAMCGMEGLRGLVVESYGSGNAPTDPAFLSILRRAVDRGLLVANVTQCQAGRVDMSSYEAGVGLRDAGIVSGGDITSEAAITKMMFLLANVPSVEQARELFVQPLCGEISR